jgi:hypothetical protein
LVAALACLVDTGLPNLVDELLLVVCTAFHNDVNLLLLPCMHLLFALLSCLICFTLKRFGSLLRRGSVL